MPVLPPAVFFICDSSYVLNPFVTKNNWLLLLLLLLLSYLYSFVLCYTCYAILYYEDGNGGNGGNADIIGCPTLKSFIQESNTLRSCSFFTISDCPQLDASIYSTLSLPLSCRVIIGKSYICPQICVDFSE